MDEKKLLEKIYDKVEHIAEDQSEMKVTLGKQHVSLEEHIKRSKANEENLELLRKEFKPIQSHVAAVDGVVKAIGIVASAAGIVRVAIELFK